MASKYKTLAEAVANVWREWPENGFTFQDMKGVETSLSFREMEENTARRAAASP